jgi:hypothetical protein
MHACSKPVTIQAKHSSSNPISISAKMQPETPMILSNPDLHHSYRRRVQAVAVRKDAVEEHGRNAEREGDGRAERKPPPEASVVVDVTTLRARERERCDM